MPENHIEGKEPLWILIEREIQKYTEEDFSEANSLETSRKIAAELDETGYNVSKSGGNWMRLKAAVKARGRVGRPFMDDFNLAVSSLGLNDIEDPHATAMKIIRALGNDWPTFLASEHRPDVDAIVQKKKVDLMIARAKELSGEQGMRYLISESFEPQAVMEALGVLLILGPIGVRLLDNYLALLDQALENLAHLELASAMLETYREVLEINEYGQRVFGLGHRFHSCLSF